MNRTIEDIQKDIELLGIKGGYDIEQLLTPQDCRRLSYEIERLNNIINDYTKDMEEYFESNPLVYIGDYDVRFDDLEHIEKVGLVVELKFITTIKDKLKELKNCTKESQNDAIKSNDEAIKGGK